MTDMLPLILAKTKEHVVLTGISMVFAIAIGVPLGISLTKKPRAAAIILGGANVTQTIPSLAMLALIMSILIGISSLVGKESGGFAVGPVPAVIALVLYALLPILRNTVTGIEQVDPAVVEVATGMGMTPWQILRRVQIPLALPVIMSGIRVATVINVGIATLCTYIGAGGLGDLIAQGLTTINVKYILSGTIPAAILALLLDGWLGLLEFALKLRKRLLSLLLGVIFVFAFSFVIFGSFGEEKKDLVVSGKQFTEQDVLAEIAAQFIENRTDLSVRRRTHLGGTMVCFNGLRAGEIDLYVEYTGTGLSEILKYPVISDPDECYRVVKEAFRENYGIEWLKPLGFNNTYALMMRKKDAEELSIETISDLTRHSLKLAAGFDPEFRGRPDGFPALKKVYGLRFKDEPRTMDPGLMYLAVREGAVDVISGYATDGRIKAYDLKILKDDKKAFPPYEAAIILSPETVKRYSELPELLNELSGKLDNSTMQRLNFEVDEKKRRPAKVAREWLKKKELLK